MTPDDPVMDDPLFESEAHADDKGGARGFVADFVRKAAVAGNSFRETASIASR